MTRMMMSVLAGAMLLSAPAAALANSGSLSQQQAQREIAFDGYTHVQNMHKTRDGWTANAMEGKKQVSLLVDNKGNVEKR